MRNTGGTTGALYVVGLCHFAHLCNFNLFYIQRTPSYKILSFFLMASYYRQLSADSIVNNFKINSRFVTSRDQRPRPTILKNYLEYVKIHDFF